MQFEVLAGVRVLSDADGSGPAGRIQQRLLGMLLASANRPVSADVLVDALWGGVFDPRAVHKLHVHVHRLRHALGEPERLIYDVSGYQITVFPGELDAARFEATVDEGVEVLAVGEPRRGAELLRKALQLWRGQPYQGLDLPQLAGEVKRLHDRRMAALVALYEAELAGNRPDVVVAEVTELVKEHPFSERLYELLVTAHAASGQRADALRVYQQARDASVDELGIEPGPGLRDLEQQILAGESVTMTEPAAGATPPPVPAQLPANVAGFVGRAEELAELDAIVSREGESARIVVVSGSGGVGKTALVVQWAHQVKDQFPDGQLYVDLRGYGPNDPVEPSQVLGGFLRAFGVEGSAIPEETSERSSLFRSLIDNRRMLIVLDNANTVDQVQALLPGTSSCAVVVTTRDTLARLGVRHGADQVELARMSSGEARLLLQELLGPGDDEQVAARLTELCAGLPLALRIAAERLRGHPDQLETLVEELGDERSRLGSLQVGDDISASVRAVLSWSYDDLPAHIARLFRICGLHPGQAFDSYAIAALLDTDVRSARRGLDTLERCHLIEQAAWDRFGLHDLLSAYATELVHTVDSQAQRQDAFDRLCDYYLETTTAAVVTAGMWPWVAGQTPSLPEASGRPLFEDQESALAWLDAEQSNLNLLAVRTAEYDRPDVATQLSKLLWKYLDLVYRYDAAEQLHRCALTAAHTIGDTAAEATAVRALGWISARQLRYDDAEHHFQAALRLYQQLDDATGQGAAFNGLGTVCATTGHIDEAVRHFERGIALQHHGDPTRRTAPLANLGRLHHYMGRHEDARRYLEEAVQLTEDADDQAALTRQLVQLAMVCRDTGADDEAFAYAWRGLELALDVGDPAMESLVRTQIGTLFHRQGDHDAAREYLHGGLQIAQTITAKDLVARAYHGLAELDVDAGKYPEALDYFRRAIELIRSGSWYDLALVHVGAGDTYELQGDLISAVNHWQQAHDIYQDVHHPKADELAAKIQRVREANS